jgi:hypothetical protein
MGKTSHRFLKRKKRSVEIPIYAIKLTKKKYIPTYP